MNNIFKIRWQYLTILLLGIGLGFYLKISWPENKARAKVVVVNSRGVSFQVVSEAQDILGLLNEQKLSLGAASVDPAAESKLESGMEIRYWGPVSMVIIDGGKRLAVSSSGKTVAEVLDENHIVLNPKDVINPAAGSETYSQQTIIIYRIDEFEKTVIEEIPFTVEIQGDPEMLYGKELAVSQGKSGLAEVTYLIKTKNGREVSRKRLSSKTIAKPASSIIRAGRKIVVESYESGMASWYAYKKCLCAAHPYFPKGSYLRVTNLADNKSVIVRVNDQGPDQGVHAVRIVDLDAEAFKLLAPLSIGTIEVKVEKLKME